MIKKSILLAFAICSILLLNNKLSNAKCHIDDWTALKALYESTDGDNWKNNDGWEMVKGNDPPLDCNLKYLSSVKLDVSGRIKSLAIIFNFMNGQIPPEIGQLSNLESLELWANDSLSGIIPSELGKLSKLKSLKLYNNNLSGPIPPELGQLNGLTELVLSDPGLSGTIPPELGKLNKLKSLNLYRTSLSGTIPPELSQLNNLTELEIAQNDLNGKIPPELGELYNLVKLDLSGNKFSGNIPSELGNLNNLINLYLSGNEFSSNIPSELGNLSSLEGLYLGFSNFEGEIPPELGKLSRLKNLFLNNNNFEGEIPPELGNLSNLKSLFLYKNKLTGSIPAELENLSSLQSLHLYYNELTGSIPPELGNLKSITNIRIQYNQITGSIPPELGNADNLTYLDLSYNQLSENIPAELLANSKNLSSLILNDNQLSGNIPSFFGNLSYVRLDLSNNQLSGNIPTALGSFPGSLRFLNLSNNQLSGALTDALDYNYSPQKYKNYGIQSFVIDDPNESITLSAPFNQTGNFIYQWYKNEIPIENATDTILHLNDVQFEDVGNYTLHIGDSICMDEGIIYISDPITVRRTDFEGCTDINACNYNQFAMIDDGSCEYLSCDTITNPIKIRTTNETILSDTQIKFDLVIDSLGLDYSADGLTFNLDTRRNYIFESVEVVNSNLSIVEVDVSKLYNNIISIDRINNQRLGSNEPVLSITACIAVDNIPTDEETCSSFTITGGTELASGHFISFDDIYIDIPFSNCSPHGGYGVEGGNWLPLVLTVSPQNCNISNDGLVEIKILEEGQSPYTYSLKNSNGETEYEGSSTNKIIEIDDINAGNYELTIIDANKKQTQWHICVPLISNVDSNKACNTNCLDYMIIPNGEITGTHLAKKEIEIRGFISGKETVEIDICD